MEASYRRMEVPVFTCWHRKKPAPELLITGMYNYFFILIGLFLFLRPLLLFYNFLLLKKNISVFDVLNIQTVYICIVYE